MKEDPAFVFPGQASQEVGMGQKYFERYPIARQIFCSADKFLRDNGWDKHFIDICFEGPPELLSDTRITQPALFTTEVAIYEALKEEGLTPRVVSGHSLGMYAADYAGGVFSFKDGLSLVATRGELMAEAGRKNLGKMAAVFAGQDDVELQLNSFNKYKTVAGVWIANVNAPAQTVISGLGETVERFTEFLHKQNVRVRQLDVNIAGHCPLMKEVQEKFAIAVNNVGITLPKLSIVLDTTAESPETEEDIRNHLLSQLTGRVLWLAAVKEMIRKGVKDFVEVGPGNVLSGLIRKIDNTVRVYNVSDLASLDRTLQALV